MHIPITRKGLLALAIICFLLCNSLFFTPGKDLPEVGDWFGEFSIDKLIHSAIFCGMCFLFLSVPVLFHKKVVADKSTLIIVFIFLVWAIATELIQLFFIEGRTGSVLDVLADATGVLVSFFLIKKGFAQWIFRVKPSVN